jgi:hypothetical protein
VRDAMLQVSQRGFTGLNLLVATTGVASQQVAVYISGERV